MTQKRPTYSYVWSLPQGSIRDNQKGLNRVQAIAFNDQDQQVWYGASRVCVNALSHSSRVDRVQCSFPLSSSSLGLGGVCFLSVGVSNHRVGRCEKILSRGFGCFTRMCPYFCVCDSTRHVSRCVFTGGDSNRSEVRALAAPKCARTKVSRESQTVQMTENSSPTDLAHTAVRQILWLSWL
jgi:hypothetical protein